MQFKPFWTLFSLKHRVYLKSLQGRKKERIFDRELTVKAKFEHNVQLRIQKKREMKKKKKRKKTRKIGNEIIESSYCIACDLKFGKPVKYKIHCEIFHQSLPRKGEEVNN